ncbi:MAG: type II toxin-antitoxin system PemK/MazF family toxin [Chloroflexota bacterium]|nr:type II toxin-antitoxin system PemK/MazF family toxin [Chloroflexota bacterium]
MVGDIVILPFPYADSADAKDRPTVLLADVGDGRYADWIVCPVTTSPIPHRRAIPIGEADLVAGSLDPDSKVRPDRLATFAANRFGNTIARLTEAKTAEVLAVVRSLF